MSGFLGSCPWGFMDLGLGFILEVPALFYKTYFLYGGWCGCFLIEIKRLMHTFNGVKMSYVCSSDFTRTCLEHNCAIFIRFVYVLQ